MHFTEKLCFGGHFGGHLVSEAWEHHGLTVFGLVNAPEVPPFDVNWDKLSFKCHFHAF